MTKEQIVKFEYCKNHLKCISGWTEKLPFKIQQYGCRSSAPDIEHTLERIHGEMFEKIRVAMNDATDKIQGIIDDI